MYPFWYRLQGSPLVAFGRSLGGAVSIELAHRFPTKIKAVVVENTFLSIAAMVDRLMPYVSALKFLILRIGWNSDAKIQNLEQPIFFISGEMDELVPPVHMRKLAELALRSSYKEFFSVPGGTHNDTWERAFDYYEVRRLWTVLSIVLSIVHPQVLASKSSLSMVFTR
jgi:pimeloyl-ACP methyl ester carboxylesterase